MIVIDSNVISTLMQGQPNTSVLAWFDRQILEELYLPSIVVAEIRYGLCRMPVGQRQALLMARFTTLLETFFNKRILPFHQHEAEAYATLRAKREVQGKPIGIADAQIAAIAKVHDFAVATRNIKDFQDCGIKLINPFE